MIRTTPIYVTWISAGNILPGFFFEAKESHESLLGVDGRREVLEHRGAGRREKEKGIDNPQAIPSRKIKKRWTKGKQSANEKYAGYDGRIRWKGWPTRTTLV